MLFIIAESGNVKSHQASVSLDFSRCSLLSVVKAVGSGEGLVHRLHLLHFGSVRVWSTQRKDRPSILMPWLYFWDTTNLHAEPAFHWPTWRFCYSSIDQSNSVCVQLCSHGALCVKSLVVLCWHGRRVLFEAPWRLLTNLSYSLWLCLYDQTGWAVTGHSSAFTCWAEVGYFHSFCFILTFPRNSTSLWESRAPSNIWLGWRTARWGCCCCCWAALEVQALTLKDLLRQTAWDWSTTSFSFIGCIKYL